MELDVVAAKDEAPHVPSDHDYLRRALASYASLKRT